MNDDWRAIPGEFVLAVGLGQLPLTYTIQAVYSPTRS
jgi:hypothetical protein